MTSNDDYVLQMLQERGLVTAEQADAAVISLKQEGETAVDVLVKSGVVDENEILRNLSEEFGMEFVPNLNEAIDEVKKEMLRKEIPHEEAHKFGVVPVDTTEDGTLVVALADPMNFEPIDRLQYLHRRTVSGIVTSRSEINRLMERFYPGATDLEAVLVQMGGDVDIATRTDADAGSSDDDADAPVIRLVSLIIAEAFKRRASDIHLEPMEKTFRVRYRVDGALFEAETPPKRLQAAIIQRVKIMANLKISERRIPQDGRIQVNVGGRDIDLRVSSVPTNHGESIVMRILDKKSLSLGLPELGFLLDDQKKFEQLINSSDGVVLVTGPTGSGKTTTLYACLMQINLPDRKIITVEDPVEYQLAGVNQVQVNRDVGLDFSAALRSILRQAPNIVMIGEIRDRETADIALEAALTGHLVFSTLHTNDAPSAITRLLDIGVKPFLVASAVRAALAQRLIRTICAECKEPYRPTDRELRMLGNAAQHMEQSELFKGRGCPVCSLTGYKGRKGIFEIFVVDDAIQHMIFEQAPSTELRAHARSMGMRTLREDGLLKAVSGVTSLEEVLRATMGDED
ncbi:MAG: GspE/PulE family protein [Kiritimatiellia bacterium]|jgi:type IV pilus assembly protein PilB